MKIQPAVLAFLASSFSTIALADPSYQIGSEWGKKPVTLLNLARESKAFQKAATATARFSGATSFYLGVYNGKHVMATNHHVLSSVAACRGASVHFPILGIRAACQQVLGTWSQIDLTLFTIEVSPEDRSKLACRGLKFAFHATVTPMQELLTTGFGVADNYLQQMVANQDSDCKVFSRQNEFRLLSDPDEFRPANYRAWSMAIGCESSHGDSGSPVVDRDSGEVVGLIWTSKTPKAKGIRHSKHLEKIFQSQSNEIWTELAYAVPAAKIFETLTAELQTGRIDQSAAATVRAILGQ